MQLYKMLLFQFLTFTKSVGNDLSSPHPPAFPGLKPGDRWGLCAGRWLHPLNVFGLILVWKRLGEQCLAQSGLDWTLVRPGGLSENDGRAYSIPKAWCLAARVRLDNQLN